MNFWADETGSRTGDVCRRGDAARGRTPVVRLHHKLAGPGLILAVNKKCELRLLNSAIKAARLISLLVSLVRNAGHKMFLILERLPCTAPPRSEIG